MTTSTDPTTRPLHDVDAEKHVLGSWLHGRKALDDPDAHVTPDDFHAPRHETIAATIQAMHARGEAVDPITVADRLLKDGQLTKVGGAPYLSELYSTPVTTSNAAYYARIVRDRATLRRLHTAATRIAQLAQTAEGDTADIVETARAEIDTAATHDTARVVLVSEEIDAWIENLETDDAPGIPTPWPELTTILNGGWKPGRQYVIGARPAVGKSLMGLQAALHATRHGHVGFYSLEMPRDEVINRAVSQIARVPLDDIEKRTLNDDAWTKVAKARGILADLPLAIDDRPILRPVDIRTHARALSRRGPLAMLVVDYLQLMAATRGDQRKRHEQVGEWSRLLKILAKELCVPVLVLSQLNRDIEHRTNPEPTLADLRESGSIEQDADVVILLHPVDPDSDGPDADDVKVGVAKNRQGRQGAFTLERQGQYARLVSKIRPHQSTPPDERYR